MEPSTSSTFAHFSPRPLPLLTKCKIRGDAIFRRLWEPSLFHFLNPKSNVCCSLVVVVATLEIAVNPGEPRGSTVGVEMCKRFPRGKWWEQRPMACTLGGEKFAQFME